MRDCASVVIDELLAGIEPRERLRQLRRESGAWPEGPVVEIAGHEDAGRLGDAALPPAALFDDERARSRTIIFGAPVKQCRSARAMAVTRTAWGQSVTRVAWNRIDGSGHYPSKATTVPPRHNDERSTVSKRNRHESIDGGKRTVDMSRPVTARIAAASAVLLAGSLLTAAPAVAEASDEVADAVRQAAAASVADSATPQIALGRGSGASEPATARGDSADATFPIDGDGSITFDSPEGVSIRIGIPADGSRRVDGNVVTYEGESLSSAALLRTDGSLQMFSVHDDDSTPVVSYPLTLPTGTTAALSSPAPASDPHEPAVVSILDAEGGLVAFFGRPWAVDAAGRAVDTHYELKGDVLVQVVDLDAAGIAFPVVADPYAGYQLYSGVSVTFYGSSSAHPGQWKVNATPTSAAETYSAATIWSYHTNEVTSKLNQIGQASRFTKKIEQQFLCHIYGLPLSKPQFNLESWREDWTWGAMVPWGCNYPEGGWGSLS